LRTDRTRVTVGVLGEPEARGSTEIAGSPRRVRARCAIPGNFGEVQRAISAAELPRERRSGKSHLECTTNFARVSKHQSYSALVARPLQFKQLRSMPRNRQPPYATAEFD